MDSDSEDQIVYDHAYHYFVQQTSRREQVYVFLARQEGLLTYLRAGIWCRLPSGGNYTHALDPTLLAERNKVVNYFQRLDSLALQCRDLEQLKVRLDELKNPQPAAP